MIYTSTQEIEERDKPFILALISAGILALLVAMIGLASLFGEQYAVQVLTEVLKFVFPLVMMAWSFYLGKKKAGD